MFVLASARLRAHECRAQQGNGADSRLIKPPRDFLKFFLTLKWIGHKLGTFALVSEEIPSGEAGR